MSYWALQGVTKEEVPKHCIAGTFLAKIVDVYDGDTCRAAFYTRAVGGTSLKSPATIIEYVSLRLVDFDAPEMRSKNKTEKAYATEVRDTLRALIKDRMVVVNTLPRREQKDPYGRTLGRVFIPRRGDEFVVLKRPPESAWCCIPWRRAPRRIVVPTKGTPGRQMRMIRNREIAVPYTADVPASIADHPEEYLESMLNINEWMLENAAVKPCTGARSGYTEKEIEEGYELI